MRLAEGRLSVVCSASLSLLIDFLRRATVSAFLLLDGYKVVIEHYIVIVLLNVAVQVEVLAEKAHQLVTRSVICNHGWL